MLIYDYQYRSNNKCHASNNKQTNFNGVLLDINKAVQTPIINKSHSCLQDAELQNITPASTLKKIFFEKFDPNDEDSVAWYVNNLKLMIRKYSPDILSHIYDSKKATFPILDSLVHYSHHEDIMVRNAARLSLLTVFSKCKNEGMVGYIIQCVVPKHVERIVLFLHSTLKKSDGYSYTKKLHSIEAAFKYCEEELEYIDDILCTENIEIALQARIVLFKVLIIPLLQSIMELNIYKSCLFKVNFASMPFVIIGKILSVVSDRMFKEIICNFFRSGEFEYKELFGENELAEMRGNVIITFKNIIARDYPPSIKLAVLLILNTASKFYISIKRERNSFQILKVYGLRFLEYITMNISHLSEFELEFMVIFLEPLMKTETWVSCSEGLILQNRYKQLLLNLYLELCKILTSTPDFNVTTLDEKFHGFIKVKHKIETNGFDIIILLYRSNFFQKQKNASQTEIEALLNLFIGVRFLCHCANGRDEKIMPLLPRKICIGDISKIGQSFHCEKLTKDKIFIGDHYLKLTSSQVIILHKYNNKTQGIVIFNAYYKDLKHVRYENGILFLSDYGFNTSIGSSHIKSAHIQLKFKNNSSAKILFEIVVKAKQKQFEILQKKLYDLFELKSLNNQ